MLSSNNTVDLLRMSGGNAPTPDVLMVALLEKKDVTLEQQNAETKNQQALIKVFEEKLRLKDQKLYGGGGNGIHLVK